MITGDLWDLGTRYQRLAVEAASGTVRRIATCGDPRRRGDVRLRGGGSAGAHRAALHPEAIIVPLFHPERVVEPAEFPDFVREQLDWARYREAHAHDIVEAEPGRFLVAGCVRWSSRAGGFIDTTAFWAVVVRDRLIYRLKGCHRQEDAQASLDADDWSPHPR